MNKIDAVIDEGRKAVDQQLNTYSNIGAWIRLRDAAPDLLAALELVIASDPIRHILKLNHRYESGCTCEGCTVEAAIEKAKGLLFPRLSNPQEGSNGNTRR